MSNPKNGIDWEAVFWEQMPRIYNFFRYRIGDNQTAQDLTSTVFEKAWRFRHKYRDDLGAFETWLFTIARNVAHDYLRQQEPLEITLDLLENLAGDFSVEQAVQHQHDLAHLHTLLAILPNREQDLIALKYGAGLTNRAIARVTSLSESNVGTILHRIIEKLRAEWEPIHG